jgi:hypothetical protein
MASFSFNAFLLHMAAESTTIGNAVDDAGGGVGGSGGQANGSPRQQLTSCDIFSTLFWDVLHPSSSGELLFADILVDYLAASVLHLEQSKAAEAAGAGVPITGSVAAQATQAAQVVEAGGGAGIPKGAAEEEEAQAAEAGGGAGIPKGAAVEEEAAQAVEGGHQPLNAPGSLLVPRMRCYGHAAGYSFNGSLNTIKVWLVLCTCPNQPHF